MTEPESKQPSPEALAVSEAVRRPGAYNVRDIALALDAAIAAGAEAALRRQAEVKQQGGNARVTTDAVARETHAAYSRLSIVFARLLTDASYRPLFSNDDAEGFKAQLLAVMKERDEALANYREAVSATERVIAERDEAVAELDRLEAQAQLVWQAGHTWSVKAIEHYRSFTSEKAAHETTRKDRDAVREAYEVARKTITDERVEHEDAVATRDALLVEEEQARDAAQKRYLIAAQELAALRKPLEGELAKDVAELREFFRYGSSDWRDKLLPALSRIEAALQAKVSNKHIGSCGGCFFAGDHIEQLHELIARSAPLGWAASGDMAGAGEWEKQASALMASYRKEPPAETPEPPAHNERHPWQFAGEHWVRVKATGHVGMVCDSDHHNGKLWFALHNSRERDAWFLPSELEATAPPAETPEPRAIVPGSVWRSDVLGYERTVRCVMVDGVSFVDKSGGTDVWPPSMFRARHAHVSDPEPAAPAPLPEPSK